MPNISTLVSDYDTKIAEIEKKYVSNSGFDSKLAQANVITKRNFDAKIVEIENSINKLKTFDLKYFRGKNRFENDGTQNYLVFQRRTWYFKVLPNANYVALRESKGLSAETIKPPTTSDYNLIPTLSYSGTKTKLKFTGSCLKQTKLSYTHGKVVNITLFMKWVLLVLILMILH